MAFVQLIDRLSRRIGQAAAWLGLLMVLVAAANAALGVLEPYTERRLTHVAIDEAEWYLFTVLFLFAAPWGLQAGAHVRVDVLYSRLGVRGRAWIDLAGGVLLAVPFTVYAVVVTVPVASEALRIHEVSNDAGGLPRYPLLMAVPLAFGLLALQGLANVVRAAAALRPGAPADDEPSEAA
ncbi:MAG: TRAP transporter small permease subunit [Planctomycetota bacterium]|nr:TRAP transporter small permease subunit [Planctomycetota bacterium]